MIPIGGIYRRRRPTKHVAELGEPQEAFNKGTLTIKAKQKVVSSFGLASVPAVPQLVKVKPRQSQA